MGVNARWLLSDEEREKYTGRLVEELPSLRAKVGISQGELAYLIGTTRQTYSAVENGKRPMPWQTYLSLILFFDNLDKTRDTLYKLEIYPTDIMERFNGGKTRQSSESAENKVLRDIAKLVEQAKINPVSN